MDNQRKVPYFSLFYTPVARAIQNIAMILDDTDTNRSGKGLNFIRLLNDVRTLKTEIIDDLERKTKELEEAAYAYVNTR